MKRLLLFLAALILVAASPADTLSDLESRGFYIESGSQASDEVVGGAVADAGFDGGQLFVVVLADEPVSGATFFADAVLDDLDRGTVLVVAPETIGWASDGEAWSEQELDAATEAALEASSDDGVVSRFAETLVDPGASGSGSDNGGSGSSGGGGSALLWVLIIGGGLVLLFFFLRSRSNATSRSATQARLNEFHTAAQVKLDDIANDILDMEEEVRLAEDDAIKQHYNNASATYAELVDSIGNAKSPQELLDVTYRLDFAIWELDVAEALLDGKTAPSKPEKPKLEPAAVEQRPQASTSRSQPEFQRRPQRQSSPTGPDLGSILLAILAAQGMGGGRSRHDTWGGGPSSSGGGFGGTPRSRGGGGRIRGGGRRRG